MSEWPSPILYILPTVSPPPPHTHTRTHFLYRAHHTRHQNISDAAMYYVEEVFARNRDSSECAKMSGGAADQLCLILNDMQHIQTTLSPPQLEGGGGASGGGDGVGGGGGAKVTSIFEDLQLEGFFSWIETEKGLGQRARSQVRDTVESTVLAIQNKIHVATEKLAQQVCGGPTLQSANCYWIAKDFWV